MALSDKAKKRFIAAMAKRTEAQEILTAIDALHAVSPAAHVAALGATVNLPAAAGTYAIPAEPTGAEVDATVNSLRTAVETRLDNVEAKVDSVITALIAAGLMS